MNGAEGPHVIAALATIALGVGFSVSGSYNITGWLLLANLPINVYPIMLQRWNRGRVFILQERMRHSASAPASVHSARSILRGRLAAGCSACGWHRQRDESRASLGRKA
jgi:hypothetical protein